MKFNSWEFLLFLPLVLVAYYLLKHKWQNRLLLIASYYFYGFWDWRFLTLILLSTLVDYTAGLRIYRSDKPAVRKFYLWLSIVVNLGILGTFKYFNFFIDSFQAILTPLGFGPVGFQTLNIVLPIGISFYTFQTMSYSIDIYRRQFVPTKNFVNFALFVAFFPQLLAGPIERAKNLLPQIETERILTVDMLRKGLLLIMIGYLKKVLIADNLGFYVDYCFTNVSGMSSLGCLQGVYYFYFQIYCDFAAYSDIARGIAYLLGIELMVNFRQPWLSISIRELWSRWHISLSNWLRDYVFFSLSKGIRKPIRIARNLFITMALGGLWHGASWKFVLWGCYFGVFQSIEALIMTRFRDRVSNPPRQRNHIPWVILRIIVVFHIMALSGILFRSPDLAAAWQYFLQLFSLQPGLTFSIWGGVLVVLVMSIDLPQYVSNDQTVFLRLPKIVVWAGYALILTLILAFGSRAQLPFIYFQF
jgi:D-alanyl-lipoteichoic acid acyltransferase DltB (MBOAT superfamily)